MDLTIAVATFAGPGWPTIRGAPLERALASAHAAGAVDVVAVHVDEDNLAQARNEALDQVQTEWVVFLDADDELETGYVDAMATGTADVRAPAVRYVQPGGGLTTPRMPKVAGHAHACAGACLPHGNWIVVGAAVRTDLVRSAGGWWDEPIYEDWSLWWRMWRAGATVEALPAAVYRAHVRPGSRNRAPSMVERNRIHHDIVRRVLGEVPA